METKRDKDVAHVVIFLAEQNHFGAKLAHLALVKHVKRWVQSGFQWYVDYPIASSKQMLRLCHLRVVAKIHVQWTLHHGNSDQTASSQIDIFIIKPQRIQNVDGLIRLVVWTPIWSYTLVFTPASQGKEADNVQQVSIMVRNCDYCHIVDFSLHEFSP